jgi:hypothetical protein
MKSIKTALWSNSWFAKSWEGGHETLPLDAPCWEYSYAALDPSNESERASLTDEDSD